MYQRLVAFRKEHNSTLVPQEYDEDPELGLWTITQRDMYGEFSNIDELEDLTESISQSFNYTSREESKNGLTLEGIVIRIVRLNDIGFVWDPLGEQWMENYRKLFAYFRKCGSTLVPKPYAADPGLGNWVSKQRASYKRRTLSEEQIRLLESIGFVWVVVSEGSE